jgi:aspartate kinase
VVPSARKIPRISYEEMLDLAASGAKVLHLRCVEYARRAHLPVHVRSSFSQLPGTWVMDPDQPLPATADPVEGDTVEQPIIAGVASDLSDCKITVVGVPDRPGEAARIFRAVAAAGVSVDMIVQNVSVADTGRTDVTFTCPVAGRQAAVDSLAAIKDEVGYEDLVFDDGIAKISLVGAGMRSHPGVSATFFTAMAEAGINITMITTSEIRISVVTSKEVAAAAVRALHTAFGLDAEGEAVVYAGTGR